jgi:hypothetical protein
MTTNPHLACRPGPASRNSIQFRSSAGEKPLSRRSIRVVALAVLIFPVTAISQEQDRDAALQREWIEIQTSIDQDVKKGWWRALGAARLTAFIEAGVTMDIKDRRGWTPLHSAARYNADPEVLLALLRAGAVVDATDRSGDTPLHWAAAENTTVETIHALLAAGADVNARDKYGWSPIHTAADRNSNPDIIDVLLAAGADRDKRAYFILFRPAFLLKHNSNMSETNRKIALSLLEESVRP